MIDNLNKIKEEQILNIEDNIEREKKNVEFLKENKTVKKLIYEQEEEIEYLILIFAWDQLYSYYFKTFLSYVEHIQTNYNTILFIKGKYSISHTDIEEYLIKYKNVITVQLFAEIDPKIWEYTNIKKNLYSR